MFNGLIAQKNGVKTMATKKPKFEYYSIDINVVVEVDRNKVKDLDEALNIKKIVMVNPDVTVIETDQSAFGWDEVTDEYTETDEDED